MLPCRRSTSAPNLKDFRVNPDRYRRAADLKRLSLGDLGQGQAAKFDIEAWMPSRFYEFQARRLNMKYRDQCAPTSAARSGSYRDRSRRCSAPDCFLPDQRLLAGGVKITRI
jgi:hypothetical protein